MFLPLFDPTGFKSQNQEKCQKLFEQKQPYGSKRFQVDVLYRSFFPFSLARWQQTLPLGSGPAGMRDLGANPM